MWHKLGIFLFPSLYWKGRSDGWFACENLVINRIKKKYPKQQKELIENLVL